MTLLPLVFLKEYPYGMSTPRFLVFWFLVLLLLLLWIVKKWKVQNIIISYSFLELALFSFLLVVFISGILAKSPTLSFFSNFERMDGIVNFSFFLIFFLVAKSLLLTNKQWFTIAKASCIVALIVALYGTFQHFKDPTIRSESTLGNPITLAFYLVTHFFLVLIYLVNCLSIASKSKLGLLFSICVIIIYSISIFFTGSRSAILSLFIGIVTFLSFLYVYTAIYRKQIIISAISIAAFFVLIFRFLPKNIFTKRIFDFSLTDSSSLARFDLWKISLEHFNDKAFLGWGKENYIYFFVKYYNNNFVSAGDWYDHSHNFLIDKLIENGLMGLLTYLILFVFVLYYVLKNNIDNITKAGIMGILVSYLVFHFANFENFFSHLTLFTLMIYISQNKSQEWSWKVKFNKIAKLIIIVSIFVFGYFLVWRTFKTYKSLYNLTQQNFNLQTFESSHEKAIIGKYDLAVNFALKRVDILNSKESTIYKQKYYKSTVSNLKKSLRECPQHPVLLAQLGFVNMSFGQINQAINTYLELKKIAPKRHVNLMDLGTIYLQNQQYEEALQQFEEVYQIDSTYKLALVNKAYCLTLMQNFNESDITLNQIDKPTLLAHLDKCTEIYRLNNNYLRLMKRLSFTNINTNIGYTANGFLRWLQLAVILGDKEEISKSIKTFVAYYYLETKKNEIEDMIDGIQNHKLTPETFYEKFKDTWWNEPAKPM